MMHGLYGLAHKGLSHFHGFCSDQQISYAVAYPNGLERFNFKEKLKPFPIVVLSVVNLLKIHSKFKKPVCVFVIDNPVQLETIGATILGCTKMQSFHYRFHPIRSFDIRHAIENCGDEPITFKPRKSQVIYDMLQAASSSSILAPLQTAMYRIKDTAVRAEMQDMFFDWLAGKKKDKKVRRAVEMLNEEDVGKRLLELMEDSQFLKLRRASFLVLNKKRAFDKMSEKFKIPLYDLRYVCKKIAAKTNIILPG